jgi:hypothetical protein|tara:strand:+ start:237 stop:452 length:216 start_codon:yes stop_codon:yes gene_type:complete
MKAQDTDEYIVYSNYMQGAREAVVVRQRGTGNWGVILKEEGKQELLEWYPTHSQSWSEDVAENFVEGIRQF